MRNVLISERNAEVNVGLIGRINREHRVYASLKPGNDLNENAELRISAFMNMRVLISGLIPG